MLRDALGLDKVKKFLQAAGPIATLWLGLPPDVMPKLTAAVELIPEGWPVLHAFLETDGTIARFQAYLEEHSPDLARKVREL